MRNVIRHRPECRREYDAAELRSAISIRAAPVLCRTLVHPSSATGLWYAFIALAIGATWDLYLHNLSLGDTGGDGSWDRVFRLMLTS